MEKVVLKTGAVMFDALHALGLAIFYSEAFQCEVKVQDIGLYYSIHSVSDNSPISFWETFEKIFEIPTREELISYRGTLSLDSFQLRNFDGLLALIFSTPGMRIVSFADLLRRGDQYTEALDGVIEKTKRCISHWKRLAEKRLWRSPANGDPRKLFDEYNPDQMCIPSVREDGAGVDFSPLITLDPSMGFSQYRSISDGLLGKNTSLFFTGARFAPFFAIIGATRFLRGQRINGSLVNQYCPIPLSIILFPAFSLPVLPQSTMQSDASIVLNWINAYQSSITVPLEYSGIAYQTLMLSGSVAPFSIKTGVITNGFLNRIAPDKRQSILDLWKQVLKEQNDTYRELGADSLVDYICHNKQKAWIDHLIRFGKSWMQHQRPQNGGNSNND